MIYLYIKRVLDLISSCTALILLCWVFGLIALLIKLDSKGPIFFKQERIGKNKEHFYILKFRTMKTQAPKDTPTHMLRNSESYITRCGSFLRKTSLDELPQIINILKGQMSVVGPRPALWNQYDLIEERDKYGANNVVPGLTGWAQVNGRDELPTSLKAKFDGEYVTRMSFIFDSKVVLQTLLSVIRSEGIKEGFNNDDVRIS